MVMSSILRGVQPTRPLEYAAFTWRTTGMRFLKLSFGRNPEVPPTTCAACSRFRA